MKPSADNIPYENPDDLKIRADDTPYENPDDLNLHHNIDSIPCENHGDLNVNSPTDNSPNENPEAVTSEYLTISESGITTEKSHALTGQYENVNGRSNQYQTIQMSDISATVNPYAEIRHWMQRKPEWYVHIRKHYLVCKELYVADKQTVLKVSKPYSW